MQNDAADRNLDPVTFEVLKNAFINLVDQVGEQLVRTCYSFVIYSRDFSSALLDARGNTVMQGTQDIAVHVGTLHFTAHAVLKTFEGRINPGDVFMINDPYAGGTHFSDVRIIRPVFADDDLIALVQSIGHWADVGGPVPGSFNLLAREYFAEGIRIPPIKIWDRGEFRDDVAEMIVSNMRVPKDRLGDLHAQAQATKVGETRLLELVDKYGKDTVVRAFDECQDYVERLARAQVRGLPQGTWETEDYIDSDPAGDEGLVPIRIKMTIEGDSVHYDLTGSSGHIGCFLNSAHGSTRASLVAGTKAFFPDIPLNSGFYRLVTADIPEDSVVNAPEPVAVTGFCTGVHEKIVNSIYELWSNLIPERAIACSFNIEYLLIGGTDRRPGYGDYFMWYDWLAGGWGGRHERDGVNATASVFGPGLAIQSTEAQERLCPVRITEHEMLIDSPGPGRFRGGSGVTKGCVLTASEGTVVSYTVDRGRSLSWGLYGGLPSNPNGVWLNAGEDGERYLGTLFSGLPLAEGDRCARPSGGGGGMGDPLERNPEAVVEDVIDGYVSVERAARDYGVVVREIDAEICHYELDLDAIRELRAEIASERHGWLQVDPDVVVAELRAGRIDIVDVTRQYGVILDLRDGSVLRRTTEQFRAMMRRRAVPFWATPDVDAPSEEARVTT